VFAVCGLVAAVTAISILGYFQQRSARADAARDLAARAVQLRNTDQSALEASTLMLIAASRRLAVLGIPSPDINAMLRESARLLLPAVSDGQHPGGVGGVAVAPGARMIATYAYSRTASVSELWRGRTDATVRVWDVPSEFPFAVLPHQSMASAAAFAGDQHLVTGTIDGTLSFWDVQQLRARSIIPFATHALGSPIVHLVVTDGGSGVHFLSVPAAGESLTLEMTQGVDRLTVSTKGIVLATDAFGTTATLADGLPRLEPVSLALPSIAASAFTAVGDRLAVVDEKTNELKVYSVAGNALTETSHWLVPQNIGALAWHPRQDKIAIAKRDGGVWMYDATTGSVVSSVQAGGNRLSFAPAGDLLAIVTPGGLKLWNWASKMAPLSIERAADVVDALFSPTAPALFTAHRDRTIRRWAVDTSGATATLEERWLADFCPDDKVLTLSAEGTMLAAGCKDDGRVRLWSAAGATLADVQYRSRN
jgi:WD40 repeat protein